VSTDPAILAATGSTPSAWPPRPQRAPAASACEPYRDLIALALARGRDAMAIWRDLVDDHGFAAQYASVRRFVVTLCGQRTPDAHPVIVTTPGEDYGESAVMLSATGRQSGAPRSRRRSRIIPLLCLEPIEDIFGEVAAFRAPTHG
jgi:hypothetical protein